MSDIQIQGSLVLGVKQAIRPQNSTIFGVKSGLSFQNSLIVDVAPADLVAVTSASSVTNPNKPTFISNGTVFYSNPSTLPSTYPTSGCQVYLECEDVINIPIIGVNLDIDDLYSWNLNLTDAGGNWSFNSINDPFAPFNILGDGLGQSCTLWGFSGAITKKGFNYSSGSAGEIFNGIFGSAQLNKMIAFLVQGNSNYSPNNPNQHLDIPGLTKIKTHSDAARLIASLADVGISWGLPDYPFFNWQAQGSETALQALGSLASDCGGVIRWNGGLSYRAMFPDIPIGDWWVPDCCLISALSQDCSLDLGTGLFNPGAYMVPQLARTGSAGTTSIIGAYGTQGGTVDSQVAARSTSQAAVLFQEDAAATKIPTPIFHTAQKLSGNSAPIDIPLDFDVETIYIQNVVNSDLTGGGKGLTTNPEDWVVLQTNLAGGYTRLAEKNGQQKYMLRLQPDWFPNNSDVDNNRWYLRVGVIKKAAPKPKVDTATGIYGKTVMKYRFVPMCVGSVTCAFFGSIPVPGMTVHASLGGKSVTGIIESVSFTNPGIITVNFVKWARMQFYTQLGRAINPNLPGFPG